MSKEYQLLSITATNEQNKEIAEAFSSCGFMVNYVGDEPGYAFDPSSMSTILVAILGTGGVGVIIKTIVDLFKTKLEVKFDNNGNVTEIKINSCMQSDELIDFVDCIKRKFGESDE